MLFFTITHQKTTRPYRSGNHWPCCWCGALNLTAITRVRELLLDELLPKTLFTTLERAGTPLPQDHFSPYLSAFQKIQDYVTSLLRSLKNDYFYPAAAKKNLIWRRSNEEFWRTDSITPQHFTPIQDWVASHFIETSAGGWKRQVL